MMRLGVSSIFDAMKFKNFLEMLKIKIKHFPKMSQIHYIRNARNFKLTFDLRWAIVLTRLSSIWKLNSNFF